ncbi:MAG: metallophosphoesterase family protein [Methylocystis sp.]
MISHLVAVGDIHGQSRKLLQLLRLIEKYMAENGKVCRRDWNLVFLGDYIDRGPNSKDVVEIVRSLQKSGAICLLGNHEDWAIKNEAPYDRDSLRSYEGIAGSAHQGLFREHLAWFRTLPLFHRTENHFFVHGGSARHLT